MKKPEIKTIEREQCTYYFDPEAKPALVVEKGETVCFKTTDCYGGQISYDGIDFSEIDIKKMNPVTGPLYIEGAEPGDVLAVEILDIIPDEKGKMCVRQGSGVCEVEGYHCRVFPIKDNKILFDHDVEIPIKPMIGVIGTCPKEKCDTKSPGRHGGNLDIKDVCKNCTVYLPVEVTGGLLSIGDCHAIQGDGESGVCGMEMNAEVVVRVGIIKGGKGIPTPLIEAADKIITAYADESLDKAAVGAGRMMHRYLTENTPYNNSQAAMMISLVANLRISQVVNPKKGCIMEFPTEYLIE